MVNLKTSALPSGPKTYIAIQLDFCVCCPPFIWSGEQGEDRALHHFPGVTAGWDLLIPTSKSPNTDSSKH